MKGKLYIVATPIGNLEDITFRAVNILKKVVFILAEDTRETAKLLNRYEITTQVVSYRDQNHERMFPKVLEKLDIGLDLALVSDCGTPLISDPGYKLVSELRKLGYEIIPIPGPSALTSAVSVSGMPTDKFTFLGFLPKSEGKREQLLKKYGELESTLVIYESPHRLVKLLEQISSILGDRDIFLAKDISKKRESFVMKKVSVLVKGLKEEKEIFGEYVVLVRGNIKE
jgi:16S rRNA (cytidine1402-2'-O)-methyltransferase